jgi:hypothetical protein
MPAEIWPGLAGVPGFRAITGIVACLRVKLLRCRPPASVGQSESGMVWPRRAKPELEAEDVDIAGRDEKDSAAMRQRAEQRDAMTRVDRMYEAVQEAYWAAAGVLPAALSNSIDFLAGPGKAIELDVQALLDAVGKSQAAL